jgi:hypothetical protein
VKTTVHWRGDRAEEREGEEEGNGVNNNSQFTLLLHVLANSRDASECSSGVKWFFLTCVKRF